MRKSENSALTKQLEKTLIIEGNHVNFTRIFSIRFIVMFWRIIIIKSRIYEVNFRYENAITREKETEETTKSQIKNRSGFS